MVLDVDDLKSGSGECLAELQQRKSVMLVGVLIGISLNELTVPFRFLSEWGRNQMLKYLKQYLFTITFSLNR
jgi:hypothetical protein